MHMWQKKRINWNLFTSPFLSCALLLYIQIYFLRKYWYINIIERGMEYRLKSFRLFTHLEYIFFKNNKIEK